MPDSPERKEQVVPQEIEVIPETPSEISEEVERKDGVTSVSTKVPSVTDDQGQVVAQGDSSQTIILPAPESELATLAKGSTTSSVTWFSVFWLRMIKKALHFGWKIIRGSKPTT